MPAIEIDSNSKVIIKSNIISNGVSILGASNLVNLDVDYFVENLDITNDGIGYESIYIEPNNEVNIVSKKINNDIEVKERPSSDNLTEIDYNSKLSIKADKVNFLEIRNGLVYLDINNVVGIGLENCDVSGQINKLGRFPWYDYGRNFFVIGYRTLEHIDSYTAYTEFNDSLTKLNINLEIKKAYALCEINRYVEGKINLKGNALLGIVMNNGAKVKSNFQYNYIGNDYFKDNSNRQQLYHVIDLNSSLSSINIVNSYIDNSTDEGEIIRLSQEPKLSLDNCTIKQNSTFENDIFDALNNPEVKIIGNLFTNKSITNITPLYGSIEVDNDMD